MNVITIIMVGLGSLFFFDAIIRRVMLNREVIVMVE